MTSVFKVTEDFSYAEQQELLVQNYRLMSEAFSELAVEFFYYIKPSEADRFFIVRIRQAARDEFIEAAALFAENMRFPALNNREVKDFLSRTPKLDDYM